MCGAAGKAGKARGERTTHTANERVARWWDRSVERSPPVVYGISGDAKKDTVCRVVGLVV
jgi:hypothetical protein